MKKIVAISGGFDPVTIGHVDLIQDAAKLGRLVVILNSDEWLKRKKGYAFMSWAARAKILLAMEGVSEVVSVDDSDGTVIHGLWDVRPHFFANGGDRVRDNTPEMTICKDLGIKPVFNVGGGKTASSSDLVNIATDYIHAADNEITGLWVQKDVK